MTADLLRPLATLLAHPLTESVGWSLVQFLWQGMAIACLLAAVLYWLRANSPNARYVAGCSALVLMAASLALTVVRTESTRPIGATASRDADTGLAEPIAVPAEFLTPASRESGIAATNFPASVTPIDDRTPIPNQKRVEPAAVPSLLAYSIPLVRSLLPWIVAVWLVGVALLSTRLCAAWCAMRRLRHRGTRTIESEWQKRLEELATRIAVSRPVRMLESTLVEVPTVIGWLRPVVLLPVSALTGLSRRQLESLLAHELAHIRRHDYAVNLVQTAIETVLFYHPAVWWVSRVIRAEREVCCDDIAVAACGDRLEYARALATMEELRGVGSQLALTAAGRPLLARVRRLVGLPTPDANRSAWWIVAATAASLLALAVFKSTHINTAVADDADGERTVEEAVEWGEAVDGLVSRLVALSPTTDDESPDVSQSVQQFATGDDVTFVVELKNVSEKPITLLGVRYGESYAGAKGKLATSFFGPHLFEFRFTDAKGVAIPRTQRVYVSDGLHTHGASTHVVEPGELLRIALRPSRLGAPMNHNLAPGAYRASVRYVGLKPKERELIVKHWPDSANAAAWGGAVVSNQVPFEVRPDPLAAQPKELVWGEEQDGLRAAVEFRRRHSEDDPDGPPRGADKADETIPLNSTLNVVLHLKNVSDETITLVSETWRQEDKVAVKTEDDQIVQVAGTWYSGWPTMVRWTLKPGDVADLSASTLAMASSKEALEDFEHPVGQSFIGHAGKYTAAYTIRIGSIQQRDEEGNVTLPTKNDWKGDLVTGETPFELRDRTPADDEAARRKLFTGKIEFVDPEGKKVQGGVFQIRSSSSRKNLAVGEFTDGVLEIPDCPPKPLTLTVRASGYEETFLNDLTLKRDEVRQIELKAALPARFRLISQGKPIAGAAVRYFNKTCADAGSGPVPMDGKAGPVWGISGEDGTVVLDTLQKVIPQYPDLGDALYYFYVESPELAPRFVGPIRAGEDAGDMVVGPYLEVRGEIRGTPEEIEHFAAEWDQPFEQTSDNPQATWLYAVSQRLELVPLPKIPNAPKAPPVTRRAFILKGLSPGKLRIIANFQKRKDGVSHTYGRRDPTGSDLLFEFDLTESRDDLVITPAGERGASAP